MDATLINLTVISMNYSLWKAMINPDAADVAMEVAVIENAFRAEHDLMCDSHPNVVRVRHHFCMLPLQVQTSS